MFYKKKNKKLPYYTSPKTHLVRKQMGSDWVPLHTAPSSFLREENPTPAPKCHAVPTVNDQASVKSYSITHTVTTICCYLWDNIIYNVLYTLSCFIDSLAIH